MEDLWRYTEARQGHRRVFALGRGFCLGGQCQKEELGQAPGPGCRRLQVPRPWWAKQDPAVPLGWLCWLCALSLLFPSLPPSWDYPGQLGQWQIVRCTLAYWERSKGILCVFCPMNDPWFLCYPGCLLGFVSHPPNGLAFFSSDLINFCIYFSPQHPGHFVTGVRFSITWLFKIVFPFVCSKSSARFEIILIGFKHLWLEEKVNDSCLPISLCIPINSLIYQGI